MILCLSEIESMTEGQLLYLSFLFACSKEVEPKVNSMYILYVLENMLVVLSFIH